MFVFVLLCCVGLSVLCEGEERLYAYFKIAETKKIRNGKRQIKLKKVVTTLASYSGLPCLNVGPETVYPVSVFFSWVSSVLRANAEILH
jgi:hypothetical protein